MNASRRRKRKRQINTRRMTVPDVHWDRAQKSYWKTKANIYERKKMILGRGSTFIISMMPSTLFIQSIFCRCQFGFGYLLASWGLRMCRTRSDDGNNGDDIPICIFSVAGCWSWNIIAFTRSHTALSRLPQSLVNSKRTFLGQFFARRICSKQQITHYKFRTQQRGSEIENTQNIRARVPHQKVVDSTDFVVRCWCTEQHREATSRCPPADDVFVIFFLNRNVCVELWTWPGQANLGLSWHCRCAIRLVRSCLLVSVVFCVSFFVWWVDPIRKNKSRVSKHCCRIASARPM